MKKMLLTFLSGGMIYALIEVIYKNETHISMFIAGGLSLCLINLLCAEKLSDRSLFFKCLTGSVIISTIEFVSGFIVNIVLKLNVWDYSHLPLNFKGQICLLFSVLWFFITIPAIYVSKIINKKCDVRMVIPKKEKPETEFVQIKKKAV